MLSRGHRPPSQEEETQNKLSESTKQQVRRRHLLERSVTATSTGVQADAKPSKSIVRRHTSFNPGGTAAAVAETVPKVHGEEARAQAHQRSFEERASAQGHNKAIKGHVVVARSLDLSESPAAKKASKATLRSQSLNETPASEAVLDLQAPPPAVEAPPPSVWESFKGKWAAYTTGYSGTPADNTTAVNTSSPTKATTAILASAASNDCSWSFWFSLNHMIMMSNLQSFIFGSSSQRPSMQPNEYMDSIIDQMKASLKDRGFQEVALPDQNVGVVVLYNGHLSGLTNLTRRGDAHLEADTDHLLLKFAVQAKDVRCAYWWRKKRIKGEVCAVVQRVILNIQLKQMVPAKNPPQLLDFSVEELDGIHVLLHGLGPLNWLVKRALTAFLRRHLRSYLEREGKEIIEQELRNIPIAPYEQTTTASYIQSFLS